MKLYYHKTDGGAEYLMDTFISWKYKGKKGKEGYISHKTKYIVRIDGDITKDAELTVREDRKDQDLKYCLDKLLDLAEECMPKYSSSDTIAEILDIYKKYYN